MKRRIAIIEPVGNPANRQMVVHHGTGPDTAGTWTWYDFEDPLGELISGHVYLVSWENGMTKGLDLQRTNIHIHCEMTT